MPLTQSKKLLELLFWPTDTKQKKVMFIPLRFLSLNTWATALKKELKAVLHLSNYITAKRNND